MKTLCNHLKPPFVALCLALLCATGCGRGQPAVETIRASDDGPGDSLPDPVVASDAWPWWRGPTRDGHAASDAAPPLSWSESKNVLWNVAVPGRGHASPIVVGNQVILFTADENEQTWQACSFDRVNGQPRWKTELYAGGFMPMHTKNSQASATPACDGQRIFFAFIAGDALRVAAVDLAGKLLWKQQAGGFRSEQGYGSSPVLHKSLVIVAADHEGASYLVALHRGTGKRVWQTPRPPGKPSYASPIVATLGDAPQLLLHGRDVTAAYNPDTGEPLWVTPGPSAVAASTVAFSDRDIFASGGYPQQTLFCLAADGRGPLQETRRRWQKTRESEVAYVPTPLYHEGHLYVVDDAGTASCFNAEDGAMQWNKRLGGNFSASPTFAAERIYAPNEDGVTFVFRAAPEFELLAENPLGAAVFASPTICGDRIYLRTVSKLYCIGQ